MDYEAVIGLEIHVELKTKSKMFSSAPNRFSHSPNTQVAVYDMAFPGAMPTLNKAAVIHGIRVAAALHMEIDPLLRFDRKNYFYPDLPKGFQITQHFHPLGKDGYLDILDSQGKMKRIGIERAHLEEDTCKQTHFADYTLLDYNRAGVPLLEIVSKPDIRDGKEAMRFVEAIRNIVVYALASDGKMEEGSLRCDVNVSLRPMDKQELGTKVEIKNLNSLKNIETAIEWEIKRQRDILSAGGTIRQQTRRYEESKGETVLMREKDSDKDYKYFPEPNLVPVALSSQFVEDAIATCPELYEAKKTRYLAAGVSPNDADVILSKLSHALYFDQALGDGKQAKTLGNLFVGEVNSYLNRHGIDIETFPIAPNALCALAKTREFGYTHKQVSEMFQYCVGHPSSTPEEAAQALGLERQSDETSQILPIVGKILDANPQSIADYKAGKDRALGFLVGQTLKEGKGKLNPATVAKIVAEELGKR